MISFFPSLQMDTVGVLAPHMRKPVFNINKVQWNASLSIFKGI